MNDEASVRPQQGPALRGSVLHVVRRFGQVSETFLTDLIADLDERGWKAWVASHHPPVNRDEFPFPPSERFLAPRRDLIWRSAAGLLAGRSARVRRAELWRPVVERVHPDVVHVHFGWAAAPFAFERLGWPVIVSFHGSDARSWPHEAPGHRRVYNELLRELRYAVASSQSIAKEVLALGFQGRIEVIHPGVDLDRFSFRMPLSNVEENRLLFVGRQVVCKGLDILLNAMRRVADERPNTVLVVVGDGPEAARNAALVQSLGLAAHVEFRGAQPHREVARELRGVQALIVPSRTSPAGEAEGHPVAPKEAFASGVPVISTSCGGLPEVIAPSQRARLVPEGDAAALAQAILDFLARPETWREHAVVARTWAEEQFDSRKLADRMGNLYEEVRGTRQPRRDRRGA